MAYSLKIFALALLFAVVVWRLFGGFGENMVLFAGLACVAACIAAVLVRAGTLSGATSIGRAGVWAAAPGSLRARPPAAQPAPRGRRSDATQSAITALRALHEGGDALREANRLAQEIEGRRLAGRSLRLGVEPIALLYIHGGEGVGLTSFARRLHQLLQGLGVLAEGEAILAEPGLSDVAGNWNALLRDALDRGLIADDAVWLTGPQKDPARREAAAEFWRRATSIAVAANRQLVVIATGHATPERLDVSARRAGAFRAFPLAQSLSSNAIAAIAGEALRRDGLTFDHALEADLARRLRSGAPSEAGWRDAAAVATRIEAVAAAAGRTRVIPEDLDAAEESAPV